MTVDTDLIVCKNEKKNSPVQGIGFFSLQDANMLWSPERLNYSDFLEKLVFRIARKPNALMPHLQRIYFCFHKNLNEQLFAAIVDFLVILNKRGLAISWRVLIGAKSILNAYQFKMIKDYLKDEHARFSLLTGNQYSIFTKGLIGVNNMISYIDKPEKLDYDPLEIARDHIEYSQLEEAKHVLENAILKQPKRFELQHELLALYQSTRDPEGFNKMLNELKQSGFDIIDEWNQLNYLFKGQNSDG
ncbi:MAG: hypothetical protein PHH59_03450 [Methylovulum sp.]|uniref:type IV pilus assembly protein FimV n=1 Tax=Methylovulum sp. TaxID=1916980 RepID=UPI002628455D|nr:hypothetical protein [Methylovulum sp.]MDD2723064.1 hypothetical protein [Methylovulum sp.]MDD5123747.1 hypothetical protein [Methylovulum sp.]